MNKFTFKIARGTDFQQKLADVREKVVFIQILQSLIDLNSMNSIFDLAASYLLLGVFFGFASN